jgi:phytoene desaturase
MEFPVLFLGARPEDAPAMYSLMNYAALQLGTWYPQGGFGKVVGAFAEVAANNGVIIKTGAAVQGIKTKGRTACGLYTADGFTEYKGIVAAADYHHVEHQLLPVQCRTYTQGYWDKRVMAPSSLIFYLGINQKIDRLKHHTLFFDEPLQLHGDEIYKEPQWPSRPLFYVCCPSKTDETVAPAGHENIFILMPLAAGLQDGEELRKKYFNIIMRRLEDYTGQSIRPHIVYQKSYCLDDFKLDYNAFKGNAYGLANTLMQTANLKPSLKSTKLDNLVYAGQLTVPGPGVPPSIISGKIAANELIKYLKKGNERKI